jgi:hypothetical protein
MREAPRSVKRWRAQEAPEARPRLRRVRANRLASVTELDQPPWPMPLRFLTHGVVAVASCAGFNRVTDCSSVGQ